MEERDLLLAHMEDLAGKALKSGYAASRFLTPAEAQGIREYFKRRDVCLRFEGGFNAPERTRAVFVSPGWGEYDLPELLAALKISYRPEDNLTHRDILGALMALGIERDTIGDILCQDGAAVIICLPELSGYIAENLTKAGRAGVMVCEIKLHDLPAKREDAAIKTDTVASLRLDSVLGAAFGLPRSKASELISQGRVSLNHRLCTQPSKELSEGTVLSVRGLGRAKLKEVGGLSKKGRLFIKIELYR